MHKCRVLGSRLWPRLGIWFLARGNRWSASRRSRLLRRCVSLKPDGATGDDGCEDGSFPDLSQLLDFFDVCLDSNVIPLILSTDQRLSQYCGIFQYISYFVLFSDFFFFFLIFFFSIYLFILYCAVIFSIIENGYKIQNSVIIALHLCLVKSLLPLCPCLPKLRINYVDPSHAKVATLLHYRGELFIVKYNNQVFR